MRGSRLDRTAVAVLAVALGTLVGSAGGTDAAFVVTTANGANNLSTNPDWKPPLVGRATVVKSEGGISGYVRAGGSYTVLASVTDDPSSNPPSGVAAVHGDVSALTAGAGAVPLSAAPSSSGGRTWSHRSAATTVPAGRAAGSSAGSVTSRDAATPVNTSAAFPFTVVVDNTAPTRTSAALANGGVVGRMDAGDTVTYLWSEVVDPESVLAGWAGAATPVTVHATNSNDLLLPGDTVTVRDATGTTQLPLGTILTNLRDYVTGVTTFGGPTNATRSTMTWHAGTGAITVRLGPPDTPGTSSTTESGTDDFDWQPGVVFDRAGNRSDTTTYTHAAGSGGGF